MSQSTQQADDLARMKNQILQCISRNGGEALFTDLEREVDGFEGNECSIGPTSLGPIYYWPSVSDLAAQSLIELKEQRAVIFEPENELLYLLDGKTPSDPVVTYAGAKRGYKTPHWAPIAICLKPRKRPPAAKARKGSGPRR